MSVEQGNGKLNSYILPLNCTLERFILYFASVVPSLKQERC